MPLRIASTLCSSAASALLALSLTTSAAVAEPLALEFLPPEITPQQICIGRVPDEVMTQQWTGWEGGSIHDDDATLIKRDLRRLMQINATEWFDTIETGFDRLRQIDPKYTENHLLLDRIELRLAAGRLSEVENERMVHQLLARADALSPRFQNAVARFLMEGIGIEQDTKRGLSFLVTSAYSGNADALLELAGMTQNGITIDNWDIDTDLSVTMALGALVGELNSTICDRIWRIAREYNSGTLVQRDLAVAETWFRFAADLGDATAAWKVAEYHLESEGFVKDNDTLVKYLTQAADSGLPYAQLELGLIHEQGALVERDLETARVLYAKAAALGTRAALSRYSLFLETHADTLKGYESEQAQALRDLADLPNPPGWVFTRLANVALEEKGRWAGESEARALLQKAVALGESDAMQRLGTIKLRDRTDMNSFGQGIDLLSSAVMNQGSITPMNKLRGAFMCKVPNAPRLAEAQYWKQMEKATGTATLTLSVQDLVDRSWREDDETRVAMQSQALYGRPAALASYLAYLDLDDSATPEQRAFWTAYSRNYQEVLRARAQIAFEMAATDNEKWSALNLMREAVRNGDNSAAVDLARLLLDIEGGGIESRQEAKDVLLPLAERGNGDAINLLVRVDGGGSTVAETYYARFADTIEARGDFEALIFAFGFISTDRRADYLDRIIASMICDFKSAVRVAEAMSTVEDTESAKRWINIAGQLTEDTPWKLVKLGDSFRDLVGPNGRDDMIKYYTAARAAGSKTANYRLLAQYTDPDNPLFDPEAASVVFASVLLENEGEALASALGRLRGSVMPVQTAVEARIDVRAQYQRAADSGDPAAMREFGRMIRDTATRPAEIVEATDWIARAAEKGDVSAMYELAQAYAYGIGTKADGDAAFRWMEAASAGGHAKADEMMAIMKLTALPSQ